jgi:peptidyl-prolyl cis-trans isomerase SurA
VDERLQVQEAREREVQIDPAEIDRALAEMARANGSNLQSLSSQLAAMGVGISTLRQQIEADIAWRRVVNKRYGGRVRISDRQISETLARVTANAAKPQFLVSEIMIPAESESEFKEAEDIAQRLLQEIRNGAPFPAVAQRFSAAASAAAGGDLGWLAQGELRGELQKVVDQLQPNQASKPVRGPGGVYILALRDRREGVDPASISRVALQRIAAPLSARGDLERQLRRMDGCAGLQRAVSAVPSAQLTDMGEIIEAELSDEVRRQITDVGVGAASPPQANGDSVSTFVVCGRQTVGAGVPSPEQIEDRLFEQELSMLAQRYLRNLRRDSTIITR